MTSLAPLLEAFFTVRLIRQRDASSHTIAAYRDSFRLLLSFAQERLGKAPAELLLTEIDAPLVAAFLDHLEAERRNSTRTRNSRLAAIRSFFRFVSFQEPAHAEMIQRVLAIPQKRFDRNIVSFLTTPEVHALLEAPDRMTWIGRRDYTLLLFAVQTGLRVSEIIGLRCEQIKFGTGRHVLCLGKGRKERCTPLTRQGEKALRKWIDELSPNADDFVFLTRRGGPLSRDAVERLVRKHANAAARECTSMLHKRITPHVLRHTTAVQLLQSGVDRSVIALWLGHESVETTQMYLHADLKTKEKALARTDPLRLGPSRYKPTDELLAFLMNL